MTERNDSPIPDDALPSFGCPLCYPGKCKCRPDRIKVDIPIRDLAILLKCSLADLEGDTSYVESLVKRLQGDPDKLPKVLKVTIPWEVSETT